jgi:hypothetical protein
MPHFIAVNYQRMLEAPAARERVKRAVHVYDLGLRALTIALVSQYLIRDRGEVCDPYLNDLLLQKFPHLTLDAWQQLFFASLKAYEGKRDFFFMPELYDFYWETSTLPHGRRAEVERPFERLTQITMEMRTKRLLPEDEAEWKELAAETKDLLRQVLRGLTFIGDYDLIRVLDYDEQFYDFELHKGLQISKGREVSPRRTTLSRGWFYLRRDTKELLLLHPLLVFWEEEAGENGLVPTDTGVYDRFVYERLQYLLATLGKTVVNNDSVKAFVSLVYDTIEDEKRKRLEAERLTWWQLRDICADISEKRMATVQEKYDAALYLQRDETRQTFEKFLRSEKKSFVLIGKSGVGKSNFLLALNEELDQSHSDICVLMYDGAHLNAEPSVTSTISQDFDNRLVLEGRRVEEVWREIAKIDRVDESVVLLCVDAINESPQAKALLKQLNELIQAPWPWLKVVITSRPETWLEVRRGVKVAQALYYREEGDGTLGVELEPFSYSEQMESFSYQELPQAYAKYQEVFDLQTPYEALPGDLRRVLQEPLNLWMVSKTYEGEAISESLKFSELVERYVDAMLRSGRLREQDLKLLEEHLVPLMVQEGRYSNALMIADIDAAGEGLYEAVYSDQVLSDGSRVNQSFRNLLDAEILVRQEEGREQKIKFKYERFYEYFVGRRLAELAEDATDRSAFFLDLAERATEIPFLWGAVKSALILETKDRGPETVLELCFTKQQHLKEMLVIVLTEYGQGDEEEAKGILEDLLQLASRRNPLSRLIRGRESSDRILNAKKIAVEVASNLGLVSILSALAEDPLSEIRAHAVRYSYYLWNERSEKGYALLNEVGGRVLNKLGLPNGKALGFCINLSILIFLDHFDEPEVTRRLQGILRSILKKVLYIDAAPLGLRGLERLGRELVLRAGVRLVTTIASAALRHFPANLRELSEFFNLPEVDKRRVLRLIDYLDPNVGDMESIAKDILKTAEIGDSFATYVMICAVLVQRNKDKEQMLSVLERVFQTGIEHSGSGAATQPLFSLYWAYLCNEERREKNAEVISVLEEFESEWVKQTRGVHHYRSGQEYFGGVHWSTIASLDSYTDFSDTPIADYVRRAVADEDAQFARDLIWKLGDIAVTHRQPAFVLEVSAPLLRFENQSVQERLVNLLARLRKHFPYAVDDFLLKHDVGESFTQQVIAAEAGEQEGVVFYRTYPFLYFEVPNSPHLRQELAELLRQIVESDSLNEGIRVVIKRLVNLVYGENVFV